MGVVRGHLIDGHRAAERVHSARGRLSERRVAAGRAPSRAGERWPPGRGRRAHGRAAHRRRGRAVAASARRRGRWQRTGRGAEPRGWDAYDRAGEPLVRRHRGHAGWHAQWGACRRRLHRGPTLSRAGRARRSCSRRLLIHQHGALELRGGGSLQVEAALRARGRRFRVLRPAIRTEHAPPPAGSSLLLAPGARFARVANRARRVTEPSPGTQVKRDRVSSSERRGLWPTNNLRSICFAAACPLLAAPLSSAWRWMAGR